MGKKNYALITGIFLIALTALTITTVYWIGHFERERDMYYVSTRESVSGLNPESTVFYRGIAVGKVVDIHFDPEDSGIILVPIEVDKTIVLSKSVYATLQLKGVTGLTQIELEDADRLGVRLEPGDDPANRIPLLPSLTHRLMNTGEDLLKKAEHLMGRLGVFLNPENEKNVGDILRNLNTLSEKLNRLQTSIDTALMEVPKFGSRAEKTLHNIDVLAEDLRVLSNDVKDLGEKAEKLAESGLDVSDQVVEKTLPNINMLLAELQTATREVERVATLIEANPQALLFGPSATEPAPGEPGYEEK